ncbi:ERF family protein [Lactiplantibacillus plajomi]|uniref:ERF family protein n=1 Tax=Lactiplantibacillus plajomi TaxID=1457217 RepID=A0ABV6K0S7_9LACO|nr:ERF family protein [Lactiplantibacillus plajomi]
MTEKQVESQVSFKIAPEKRVELQAAFFAGLTKFREQVKAPAKNGHVGYATKGGNKAYDYVLLDDLIKSIDMGLKGTGIAWYQEAEADQKAIRVRTVLTHKDGYMYQSPWMSFSTNGQPQSAGSAITYAKRYSLGTSFGVSSEADDDGEATGKGQASGNSSHQYGSNQRRPNRGTQQRSNRNSGNSDNGPLKQAMRQIELISQATGRDQAEIYQELIGQTGYADSELNNTSNAVKFFNAAKQMRHNLEGGN